MITIISGLNNADNLSYIEKIQNRLMNRHNVITNIPPFICYSGFDSVRLSEITSDDTIENILNYNELIVSNDELAPTNKEKIFTQKALDLITLLCRKGDILVLNKPDYKLRADEVYMIRDILLLLSKSYNNCYIATQCKVLFNIAERALWIQNDTATKITIEHLYKLSL